jgi:hypothetical protein
LAPYNVAISAKKTGCLSSGFYETKHSMLFSYVSLVLYFVECCNTEGS